MIHCPYTSNSNAFCDWARTCHVSCIKTAQLSNSKENKTPKGKRLLSLCLQGAGSNLSCDQALFSTVSLGKPIPAETSSSERTRKRKYKSDAKTGPDGRLVPNRYGPKIEPDRPSVYTRPFWKRSGTDPKLDLLFCRSNFGSV